IVARVQPFIVGNGVDTVEELVHKFQEERKINYRLVLNSVVVDWAFVRRQGFEEQSVPSDQEIIFLNPFSVAGVGGLTVEVTHLVPSEMKDIAVRAKDSVAGLEVAGVDIFVADVENT